MSCVFCFLFEMTSVLCGELFRESDCVIHFGDIRLVRHLIAWLGKVGILLIDGIQRGRSSRS
ncbi:hypothetical protein P389DRAFT_60944 [Cystobasidium minutum MCA 4210]|uniref:uncharacterized protein n=1 Tax=Cystobasidium minutum MCA 4210 TaxID=1397322 RepID=UPI0034CDF454|eukprot:jgi/Rhomi1/60944/CE60943_3454